MIERERELNWQDVLNSLLFWAAMAIFMSGMVS